MVFDTLTFEGRAGGTVCCFGGWEGVREREEGEQGVEEKEKENGEGGRGGEGRGGEGSEEQILFADYLEYAFGL